MNNKTYGSEEWKNQVVKLKKIISNKLGNSALIKGCSELEISNLENKYCITLPESYKAFLSNFGHGLGGIMKECDILYNDIFSLTETIRNEILIEEYPHLPEKAFVFSSRYNEQFMFFNANGIEKEPPILYYHIDNEDFSQIGSSIFDILQSEVKFRLELKNYRQQRKIV